MNRPGWRHARRAALVLLFLTVAAAPLGAAAAATGTMSVAEVKPGMRGIGRTVVRGTAVESFDVEVLAIVPGSGPSGDLILVRVSGPLIRRTGGIAAGMSGSPVFINGRLVGAIGFGWAFSDHSLGLVTPIADMLHALPGSRAEQRALPHPVAAAGRRITAVAIAPTLRAARAIDTSAPHVAAMVPVARPLLVSGMSARAAALLRAELAPFGMTLVEGAAGASNDARPDLVPGSAIGVQVIRGDLNAVAIGTLTYRHGDRLVGFGHPFLNRGATAFLLTPAVIHGVVRSTAFPFKLGTAGAPVGIISEDRRSAIGGRLGTLPPMVTVRSVVTDRDRNRTVTLASRVATDRQLGPALALAAAMEAIDRALDRIGEGTATVRLTLRGRGLDGPLVRENAFYHARDIGTAALLEVPEALRLLFANEFVRISPVDVVIEAQIGMERQTAVITEAVVEGRRARRGEAIGVKIGLRPFQGATVMRTIDLNVPEGFPLGAATVLVRAGGRPMPEQGLSALLAAEPLEPPAASAAAQLLSFTDRDRNTDLVVELVPGSARIPNGTGDASVQTVRIRTATSWVVRGRVQIPVTVEPR
ncbi:MAG: SpoIVB peptidase S55 domain-containing protein [Armatimonadota bacterium]|nr:SpoIVB peptidase S55 domain-containing protein [Armatimonadota bacterium]